MGGLALILVLVTHAIAQVLRQANCQAIGSLVNQASMAAMSQRTSGPRAELLRLIRSEDESVVITSERLVENSA